MVRSTTLDPAIIKEADEAVPAPQATTDRRGDRALPRDGGELPLQPGLELFDEPLRSPLASGMAGLGLLAADLGLAGIDGGDACERLGGDRRIPGLGDLIETFAARAPSRRQAGSRRLRPRHHTGLVTSREVCEALEKVICVGHLSLLIAGLDVGPRYAVTPQVVRGHAAHEIAHLGVKPLLDGAEI
jgi:hypothetical protein